MTTSSLFKGIALAATLTAALTTSVLAQPGPGPGAGMQGAGPGAGQMGPGAGGMRGMRFDNTNTPGWALMTSEERTANQTRMHAVKTFEECKALQEAQHQAMQERAKEKGVTLMVPRQNACDRMKARGWIQ